MPDQGPDPEDRTSSVDRRVAEALAKRAAAERADAERLEQARARRRAGDPWRIVVDIVAAPTMGGVFGYGLDQLLGLTPLFLILGLVAGFAIGMWLAFRRSRAISAATPGDDS